MSDWLLIEFPPQRCHEAKAGSVNESAMIGHGCSDDSRHSCFETPQQRSDGEATCEVVGTGIRLFRQILVLRLTRFLINLLRKRYPI
jgi:hypothetical protein